MRLREKDRFEHRVGDEHHRHRELAPQRDQIVVELETRDFVERRERLVHQQHARRGDERARDRDSHPHAAGKLARIGMGEVGEADARKRFHDARRGGGLVGAGELERQEHVAEHRRPGHQGRLLEYEADAPACVRAISPATAAARRLAQARNNAERRRFAAAGRPEQRQEFAFPHVEIESVERPGAGAKQLADAAQRDNRRGCRRHHRLFPQADLGQERHPALDLGFMVGGERRDALPGIGSKPMSRNFFWTSGWFTTSTIAAPSFCADVFRHFRRAVDAEPAGQHDAGNAGLLECRQIGQRRQALGTAHREAFDLPRADLLHHHRIDLDDGVEMAADQIVQGERPAR